ncbi:hypothetical protein [Kluyvera cryocrescens]|uniref:Uncharacterized protein n=1 Tax=Kluyvera cryocrescens TaxID=580 RepID=A0A485ABH4_KLUCR|nr:hypothetical protein [Kluyvera cryocrescens]VFS57671.1 Uncharacterised protein [Kluyvera cryocrescens]
MTSLNLASKGSVVTEKTIDSQSLLKMVNQARNQCGEPGVRNNKFIEKVEDELDGEFYTKSVKPSGTNGGRPVEVIEMSIKQALRVAARESKAVRRSLVDKLEDMQVLPAMPKSNTGITEYRLAKAEQLKAQALEKNIASAREIISLLPRLDPMAHQVLTASLINPLIGYDAIPLPVIEEHYHTAGEVGEMLGVSAQKIGRVANAHKLKTDAHGKFFLDKSAYSSKQVEAFRYNTNGIDALRHLIHGADVA